MKKLTALLLILAMTAALAGCGGGTSDSASDKKLEGELTDIIASVYENHGWEDKFAVDTFTLDDDEMLTFYTGLENRDHVTDIAVSAPLIGSIAYSIVMVRVDDAANAEDIAQKMKDNIDVRRWICVSADDLLVSGYGDVVMLVMVDYAQADNGITAQSVTDAFRAVCGSDLDFTI